MHSFLQESAPLRIFKTSGKRVRGVVWPADRQAPIAIPDDCSAGDLVEATEFLHVSSYLATSQSHGHGPR